MTINNPETTENQNEQAPSSTGLRKALLGNVDSISPDRPPASCRDCGRDIEGLPERLGDLRIAGLVLAATLCSPCAEKRKNVNERRLRLETIRDHSSVPAWAELRGWDTFRVDERNADAVQIARGIDWTKARGLALLGPVGTGKSHLAACIANKLITEAIRPVTWENAVELMLRLGWEYRRENGHPWPILERLGRVPVLVLDDLGREKASDSTRQMLYTLINRRVGNLLPTIVTSNYSLSELSAQVGEAVVSRLQECCEIAELHGGDRRVRSARKE